MKTERLCRLLSIPLVFIVGYSDSGKTTVAEALVRSLKERAYRVAVIKHAAHGYQSDPKGKDSWRYRQADADSVVVVGPQSYTLHRRLQARPRLNDILRKIRDVDIIIVEGFKSEPGPKIEVFRKENNKSRLSEKSSIVALVSDFPLQEDVPCFSFEQSEELAEFVITNFIKNE